MSTHSAKVLVSKRSVSSSTSDSKPSTKKCATTVETVEKKIRENDKTFQMASWLKYEKGRGGTVTPLKCELCIRYREKVENLKNALHSLVSNLSQVAIIPFVCVRACVCVCA